MKRNIILLLCILYFPVVSLAQDKWQLQFQDSNNGSTCTIILQTLGLEFEEGLYHATRDCGNVHYSTERASFVRAGNNFFIEITYKEVFPTGNLIELIYGSINGSSIQDAYMTSTIITAEPFVTGTITRIN